MNRKEGKNLATHVSKGHIQAGLRRLGLTKGDNIGVHSSLSSFGYVEGGADTVIDALREVVSKEGTIVMPTHSANLEKVERSPEEIAVGVSWLYKILPYDPHKTPCTTGSIPEAFRKRQDVRRSLHHAHSIAAIGPNAKAIVEAGKKNVLDAWKHLLENNGYILLLGVDLGACTAMHLAEERVTLPNHIREKITPPKWFVEKYPEDQWEWDVGPYPAFAKMECPCIKHNIMKTVTVGEATLKLMKLEELIDLYEIFLNEDPTPFYTP